MLQQIRRRMLVVLRIYGSPDGLRVAVMAGKRFVGSDRAPVRHDPDNASGASNLHELSSSQ